MKRIVVLGLLLLSLFALNVALPGTTATADAYECPPGQWYCWTNRQCAGFCEGVPSAADVCSMGCCNCLG